MCLVGNGRKSPVILPPLALFSVLRRGPQRSRRWGPEVTQMDIETLNLAELKVLALGFDRAEMRDVHIVKDGEDYVSKRHMGVWNVDKN